MYADEVKLCLHYIFTRAHWCLANNLKEFNLEYLEYGVFRVHIESVQKKPSDFGGLNWDTNLYLRRLLLINLHRRLFYYYLPVLLTINLAFTITLPSLTIRRTMLGVVIQYILINGYVNNQYLLTQVIF